MQVDAITVEALKTGVVDGTNLIIGSVAAGHLAADSVIAGKIAADAIGAREIMADAIGVNELSAASVTARAVAAGAITAEKLTIVGQQHPLRPILRGRLHRRHRRPNHLGHPGQNLRQRVPEQPADRRHVGDRRVPGGRADTAPHQPRRSALPRGGLLRLGSLDRRRDQHAGAAGRPAAGAILSYGKAATTTPVRGAWTRLTTSPDPLTAPPNAAAPGSAWSPPAATAGTVWWDNAAVRPVVPGELIADGSITAPKIVALAITTEKLAALAITAEKIAALAVTTAKLDALAVTADKLAVNSVTATKIDAGAVEATHIKAGAIEAGHIKAGAITAEKIDADALNGKIITGAVVQTAATGNRISVTNNSSTGVVTFWDAQNRVTAELSAGLDDIGMPALLIKGPIPAGAPGWNGRPYMTMGADGVKGEIELRAQQIRVAQPFARTGTYVQMDVEGYLQATNIRMGRVVITPSAPNVPTSVTVTGLGLPHGSTVAYANAAAVTAAPGTKVTGASISDAFPHAAVIWLTRTDTTPTAVDYLLIAKA
ncbi:hypothetical protein LUR56_40225 [Streptomyces sp. MT29]|nr:hypothetical protein [Streptomyces sp. MT29]